MKELKGSDIILNLKEIDIGTIDTFASSHCGGRAYFEIECETEQGYCEDPDFTGKIKILSIQKDKQKGVYTAKIRFIKEKNNYTE
jgi:hypothetical protein